VALLASAFGAGCYRIPASTVEGGELLDQLRADGVVRLGIAGEVPFGYIDRDGAFTGEAPEIAKVIFRRLGVERVRPVPTEFGSLIPGLRARQFDVVSAGMYVTPTRCAQVLFSDPDYQMRDAFIVARGNPKGLHRYEDIVRTRAMLATGTGYAELDYAIAAGVDRDAIRILPDQLAGLLAVEQGRADVFAGTSITVQNVVRQSGSDLVEATQPFQPMLDGKPAIGAGAFAFHPNERNLRDAFNRELDELRRSGELLRIVEPFGFTEANMTDLTARELCEQ
jgi:polar amino acid transport system substrate-binding protein